MRLRHERGRDDRAAPAATALGERYVAAGAGGAGRELRVHLANRGRPAPPLATRDPEAGAEARRVGAVPRDRIGDDDRGGPRDPALGVGAAAPARRLDRGGGGHPARRAPRGPGGGRRRGGDARRDRARGGGGAGGASPGSG